MLRVEKGKETSDRDAERGCVKQTMQRQTIEHRVSGKRLLFPCLGDFLEDHLGRPKGVRCNCRGLEVRRRRRQGHCLDSTSSACPRSFGSRRWTVQGLFREQPLDFPCAWDKAEMVACCSGSTSLASLGDWRREAWRVNLLPPHLSPSSAATTCLVPTCAHWHLVPMLLLFSPLHAPGPSPSLQRLALTRGILHLPQSTRHPSGQGTYGLGGASRPVQDAET